MERERAEKEAQARRRREGSACDNTRPWPKLQGGTTEGHGSLGAEGGVVQPRVEEGLGWLEDEGGRAEFLGLAGGNQLEEGGVVRVLLSTLLSASRSKAEMATSGYWM